jgi:tetratricopeptide (TPR) repeat protein
MEDKNLNLQETYTSAVQNQQKGNFAVAENLYKKILKKMPAHVNTLSNLGTVYLQINDIEKATFFLQGALKIDPNSIIANSNLGVVFNRSTEYTKAIECFQKVINIDPKNADAYNNLAINYRQLGEYDLAKNCLYKAIEIDPNHVNGYNNLGTLLGHLGENDKAIEALNKALEIAPNFLKAQNNLSITYLNDPKNIDKSVSASYQALTTHCKVAKVYNNNVPLFRLKHDVGQAEYLKLKNYSFSGLNAFIEIGKEILGREENKETDNNFNKQISLKDNEVQSLLPFSKVQYIYKTSQIESGALNPKNDWKQIESKYLNSAKQIIYIDDFLSEEAIKELREFSLASKVWVHHKPNKYLGAYSENGFTSPLHLQLRTDLQKKLPNLFGKYTSGKFWGYKYDTNLGGGIAIHADFAYLNLNFWITPDKYNNDKNRGGLKVYDAAAPEDWSFVKYNTNAKEIYKFLKEKKANCESIPYKYNRAVLFNSAYFHETDAIDFKEGYEGRRINITYLFGSRQIKKLKSKQT